MSKHTVLFELGCEELPPKSLKTLRDALKAETVKGLKDAGLNFASIEAYAAPRRLALKIVDIDEHQGRFPARLAQFIQFVVNALFEQTSVRDIQ